MSGLVFAIGLVALLFAWVVSLGFLIWNSIEYLATRHGDEKETDQ
jgi:hypothetical protein